LTNCNNYFINAYALPQVFLYHKNMIEVFTQASLLNLPRKEVIRAKSKDIMRFMTVAGYDWLQYVPVRTAHRTRFAELARESKIGSMHQSFAHGVRPQDLLYRVALSGVEMSTRRIAHMRKELSPTVRDDVPTVVHPNQQYLGNRPATWRPLDYQSMQRSGVLGPLLHQPTVETLHAWGLYSSRGGGTAADLQEAQSGLGFDGIALDLHHLTAERAGERLPSDWVDEFVAATAKLGGLSTPGEVQASLRPDFGGNQADVRLLMDGNFERTRAGELLGIIRDSLPVRQQTLRVTTEVAPEVFGPMGYVEGNRALVTAVRNIFNVV
jgi:hypothetical protein